jgi:ATP-binding cassette subfamily B protein
MAAFVSFERVFEVLDAQNPVADAPDAQDPQNLLTSGGLRFDNVSFRYPSPGETTVASLETEILTDPNEPERLVLKNIDLSIEPGKMLAIVGPSGAGKSTMASLIPRLYDVTEGAVSIDGHDVRLLTQDGLRARIGVVSQDPHLFHESIGENLRYARPEATDQDLIEACRSARILHVIEDLPEGFDTMVGERGYRLSGGENNASLSPACWLKTRSSSFWTKPPATSIPKTKYWYKPPSAKHSSTEPLWLSLTGFPP